MSFLILLTFLATKTEEGTDSETGDKKQQKEAT